MPHFAKISPVIIHLYVFDGNAYYLRQLNATINASTYLLAALI